MAKRKAPPIKAPKTREFLAGCDGDFVVELLKSLDDGDVDKALYWAYTIGQYSGSMKWIDIYHKSSVIQMPLVQGYFHLKAVDIDKIKKMHVGKGQLNFPLETKRKAVDRFNELMATHPKPKMASVTDRVCKEFGMGSRTLDGWRKSFASR